MRVAWIGGPDTGGGVGGFCRQLLQCLIGEQIELVLFADKPVDVCRSILGQSSEYITIIAECPTWEWGRWYSKNSLSVFLSSFHARTKSYARIVDRIGEAHREKPFDVILQFSQAELFGMRKKLKLLPPFLLFPCVHAAGELRWHQREMHLARKSESFLKHMLIRASLIYRSQIQRKCYNSAYGVIGMSHRFNELVRQDYGLPRAKQAVVYQPVDFQTPTKAAAGDSYLIGENEHKVKLLFVGRISVRKGIEMLVLLSRRLGDLKHNVELKIVGGASFWSDYTRLLDGLDPKIATYHGAASHSEVVRMMQESDVLLVPSHYEPGGIVVAEGLVNGCLVVASTEVGSAEPLTEDVCIKFPAGDMESFEASVLRAIGLARAGHQRINSYNHACDAYNTMKTQSALLSILGKATSGVAIGADS